jgi:CheY-like chemotaxis protein
MGASACGDSARDIAVIAESILEQAGHVILSAHTVAEAQIIICSGQTVDLVFTDLKLGRDADGGTAVGELVNRRRSETPVLYTSGQATACTPCLPKPYTAPELTRAVANLLREAQSFRASKM